MQNNTILKKTKIVATIGPATENLKTMTEMAEAGMNMARLNFSHGDHAEHLKRLVLARQVSKKLKQPLAVLQDLSGPKIRTGDFYKESITLKEGQSFIFTTDPCVGDEKKVSVNYPTLHEELKPGNHVLVHDGKYDFVVEKIIGKEIHCTALNGGDIKGKRGVNLPGAYLKISALTAKDRIDLKFGIKNNVDFMALSFVRTAKDVLELKDILKKAKADIKVISKIETAEAIENLDEIIQASHGIMVARGDLAVEVPAERVPIIQKEIIRKCNDLGKPVITATQMMESMIKSPVPTRAEVSDVANAILDGTDAVMLSEETTLGMYPVKAIQMMARVARYTEEHFNYEQMLTHRHLEQKSITDSISFAVVNTAHNIGAKTIVAFTESGFTARMISRHKPEQCIIALTPHEKTYNRLALSFGCYPQLTKRLTHISKIIEDAKKIAVQNKLADKGDTIIISFGTPLNTPGTTNTLVAQTI